MLNVILLIVNMLNIIVLIRITVIVIMLQFILQNVILLTVIMVSVLMLIITAQNAIMLSVVVLSVVAPLRKLTHTEESESQVKSLATGSN